MSMNVKFKKTQQNNNQKKNQTNKQKSLETTKDEWGRAEECFCLVITRKGLVLRNYEKTYFDVNPVHT